MSTPSEAREAEQKFRDEITADFKAGKIGIENGWLFEYVEPPAGHSCTPYGCPPSCYTAPIMDLWTEPRRHPVGTDETKRTQVIRSGDGFEHPVGITEDMVEAATRVLAGLSEAVYARETRAGVALLDYYRDQARRALEAAEAVRHG